MDEPDEDEHSVEMHTIRHDLRSSDFDAPDFSSSHSGSFGPELTQRTVQPMRKALEPTDLTTGLGRRAAERRLKVYGYNLNPWLIRQDPSHSAWPIVAITAHTLASGLLSMGIYVLLSVIALKWWQVGAMAVLLAFFLLVTWIHVLRWRSATRQMRIMLQLRSHALRDGVWMDIPSRELVPGDIVELRAGMVVPATCVIRECSEDVIVDYRSILSDRHILTDISESADTAVVQVGRGEKLLAGATIKSGEAYRVQVIETGPSCFLHHQYDGGVLSDLRRTRRRDLVYTATRSLIALVAIVFIIACAAALLTSILSDRPLAQVLATATSLIVFTAVHNPVALVLRWVRTEGALRLSRSSKNSKRDGVALHSFTTLELLAAVNTIALDVRGFLASEDVAVKKLYPMQNCTASGLLMTAVLATTPEAQAASLAPHRKAPVGDMEALNMAVLEELRLHKAYKSKNAGATHDDKDAGHTKASYSLANGPLLPSSSSAPSLHDVPPRRNSQTPSHTSMQRSASSPSTPEEKKHRRKSPRAKPVGATEPSPTKHKRRRRPKTSADLRKPAISNSTTATTATAEDESPGDDLTSSVVIHDSPFNAPVGELDEATSGDLIIELPSPDKSGKPRGPTATISSSSANAKTAPYIKKPNALLRDPCLDSSAGDRSPMELKNYTRLGALFPPGCTIVHLQAETEEALKFAQESNPLKMVTTDSTVNLKMAGEVKRTTLKEPSSVELSGDPNDPLYRTFLVAKGDPRSVIRLCVEREDEAMVNQIECIVAQQNARGRSVIAVAKGPAASLHVLEHGTPSNMHLVGLICFEGTLMPDTLEALADAAFMSLNVKLITNDSVASGTALGSKLGIGSNVVTVEDYLANDPSTGGKGLDVNAVNGFADVTPENKIHLALAASGSDEDSPLDPLILRAKQDTSSSTRPVRPLWAISSNDPSVLYESDIGVAHRSDVDVAIQSADVVLMRPGFNGLIRAIRTARKTISVLEAMSIVCAVESIRNIITLVAAWVSFGFQPIPTTSLIVLIALNLPMLIVAAHFEKGRLSKRNLTPFVIRRIAFTTFVVTLFEVIAAFLFAILIFNIRLRRLSTNEANSCAFLWFGLANGFMVLLCRSPNGLIFRRPWPHPITLAVVFISQLIATFLCAFGIGMTPTGWINALIVWAYTLVFFFIHMLVFYFTNVVWVTNIQPTLHSKSWFKLWHTRIDQSSWYRGLLTG